MKQNIRVATLKDLPEIKSLFEQTIHTVCKSDYNEEQREVWADSKHKTERWKNAIKDQYFLVLEMDKKLVGFASLAKHNYIDFLYVHRDYQGQGIATTLFDALLEQAKNKRCKEITSDVSITARPFFEKKGFKVARENKIAVGKVVLINYHMHLAL